MFKFNFNIDENPSQEDPDVPMEEQMNVNQPFGCLTIDQLDQSSDEMKLALNGTDLIPNVYEGGLKTWECSYDLVDYLKTIRENYSSVTRVLEVGCGSARPGMELNQYEQFHVDFQDFNREVIEQTGRELKNVKQTYTNRLYFGDWNDLLSLIPSKYYDLILTSETIYNTNNYGKLVRLLDHALQPQGRIYLAAKVYYFGVQGGIRQFEEYLHRTGLFKSRVFRTIDANVKREILEIIRV